MVAQKRVRRMLVLAALVAMPGAARSGTVITDGSLGAARTLTGPNYSIPSSLGTLHGGNLFESFQTLNLSAGDVATFSGPSTVGNVLARITGGVASSIDGTIQSTMPHAAFYLINPSGVVFGPDAALNVKDSFIVTTAEQVKLADGHVFGTAGASDATLTSASPAAFGFLAQHPAGLTINGSLLRVPTGKQITLAGGAIQINGGATVRAPQGTIGVLSVGSAALASISAGHAPSVPSGTAMADVTLMQASFLATTAAGGGRVEVDARDLLLENSSIDARTLGAVNGTGVDLQLVGNLGMSDSAIFTNTSGAGRAGDITIFSDGVNAYEGVNADSTGIVARSLAGATGAGGNVTVQARSVNLGGGEEINTTTFGSAPGGSIAVIAGRLSIDGFANDANAAPSGLLANAESTGAGGKIRVHAGKLRVESGGVIVEGTSGTGLGGDLSVTANNLTVDGTSTANPTGITTATNSSSLSQTGFLSVHAGNVHILGTSGIMSQTSGTGAAGLVSLRADSLSLAGGGELSSQTFSGGVSGDVAVDVGTLRMNGANSIQATDITAGAGLDSTGNAGDVSVQAGLIQINNTADITSNTFGSGSAGKVSVSASTIQINGRSADGFTGIDSNSEISSSGNAGSVLVKADSLSIVAGGEVSSDTQGTGAGGEVAVVANQIKLDGRGSELTSSISSSADAATSGPAGPVRVHGNDIRLIYGGQIESSTSGTGDGGEVSVTANTLVVDGTNAQGLTAVEAIAQSSSSGRAGDLSIHANVIDVDSSGLISTDTFGSGPGGNIELTTGSLKLDGAGSNFETGLAAGADQGSTGSAGDIDVNAKIVKLVEDGSIVSDTAGPGAAGAVRLHADDLLLNGTGGTGFTHISSNADSGSTGNGGPVHVQAGSISLLAGGEISSTTSGAGHGGDVTVIANQLNMDGAGDSSFTGVAANTLAAQTGAAGSIRIHAGTIAMTSASRIDDDTNGSGAGGNISISATQFAINGLSAAKFTGVSAAAEANSTGDSGSIAVRSNELDLRSGGGISALTLGTGDGGQVSVTAAKIVADGVGSTIATEINASALAAGSGAAGDVNVSAHDVHLIDATIESENQGAASPGDVIVHASNFIADAGGSAAGAGISAEAGVGSTRGAGSVNAIFDQAQLLTGGIISTASGGEGQGGDVNVKSHDLLIDGGTGKLETGISAASVGSANATAGNVNVLVGDNLTIRGNGSIAAIAILANGGNVSVEAKNISLQQGVISTSAAGAGGNIDIGPGASLVLSPAGRITAVADGKSRNDNGGNVTIGRTALAFLPGVGKDAISANANQGNGGNITINSTVFLEPPGTPADAIDSSSLGGLAGKITIQNPDLDLAGELVPLVSSLAASTITLAPTCGMQLGPSQSSFTLEGGNGLPTDPGATVPTGTKPTTRPSK